MLGTCNLAGCMKRCCNVLGLRVISSALSPTASCGGAYREQGKYIEIFPPKSHCLQQFRDSEPDELSFCLATLDDPFTHSLMVCWTHIFLLFISVYPLSFFPFSTFFFLFFSFFSTFAFFQRQIINLFIQMPRMNYSNDSRPLLQWWEFQCEIQVTLMAVSPLFKLHDLLFNWVI